MPEIQYIRPTTDADMANYPAPGEIFSLTADHGRPVLEIFVPITDDSIWIAPIDDAESAQKTKGFIHRHAPVTAQDAGTDDVDLAEFAALVTNATMLSPLGICMAALYAYVMPRAVTLMARAYIPEINTENDGAPYYK